MKYPSGKIKRIFLEYEDGSMELEGPDAEKWKDMIDAQAVFAHTHGLTWPKLNWVIRLKEATNEAE